MRAAAFRSLLETGDVDGLLSAWASWFPNMPRPANRGQAEIVMHHARTQTESLSLATRAYSHAWLVERDLPSGLPDRLKPSAERLYPRAAPTVGISLNARPTSIIAPALGEIRHAMELAVLDAEADGRLLDSAFVTKRMAEAKAKTTRALFGI